VGKSFADTFHRSGTTALGPAWTQVDGSGFTISANGAVPQSVNNNIASVFGLNATVADIAATFATPSSGLIGVVR